MVQQMTERNPVLSEIERYWIETGVPRTTVTEMRRELDQHLDEAAGDGRTLTDVIGERPDRFAETWASAYRAQRGSTATWGEVQSGTATKVRQNKRDLILFGIGALGVLGAVAVMAQGGNDVDSEVWRWLWTIFALVMAIGEIFTAGFFLLPFAIGAGAAAILAWVGSPVLAQWLVFFGLSIFSLAYLRRFITRQDEGEQPMVGANRWVGEGGLVLQDIDPHTGAGMVRVLREEWRATADQQIDAGERIVVTDVKGTRLIVELVETH